MRRILAILLICLLPLQLSLATAASLHGHLDDFEVAVGFHAHDDEWHHEFAEVPGDVVVHGDMHAERDDDGHHDGHFHHVYSMLVFEVPQSIASPEFRSELPGPSAAFTSHIPRVTDRPPLARL